MPFEIVNILSVASFTGKAVQEFHGEKKYVATGDILIDEILEDCELITFKNKPSRANLQLEAGCVIVAKMQSTTKVLKIDEENENFVYSTGFLALKPSFNLDVNFFYHYLKSNIFQKEKDKHCTGATQKAINNENFTLNLKIPLPPLSVQKEIAEKLDKADALRKKDQKLLKQYGELAQAIFIDMFGDPVQNEMGWDVKTLNKFGNISTGNTPSRKIKENYNEKYIEWIKTDNIKSDIMYVTTASEYLSKVGSIKGRIVENNSVLVACIAGSLSSIGRCALTNRNVAFNQQINAIQPNLNINSIFLYIMIKNSSEYLQSFASSAMKKMLSKSVFERIPFICPPLKLQNQFAEKIQNIEAQKEILKKQAQLSEELFQALLQESFSF